MAGGEVAWRREGDTSASLKWSSVALIQMDRSLIIVTSMSIFWVTSSRGEIATSTSLVRNWVCPAVADIHLMLPALLGLFVDVTPKVFLPMARVDATGKMT